MLPVKMLAIDLDGTFLSSQTQLISENVASLELAQKAGVETLICTGRTYPGVERFIQGMPNLKKEGYLILHNGALTLAYPSLEVVKRHIISPTIRQAILAFFHQQDVKLTQLIGLNDETIFLTGSQLPNPHIVADAATLAMPVIPVTDEAFSAVEDLTKVLLMGPKEELDRVQAQIPNELKEQCSMVRSKDVIIEFFALGVNKGQAVADLADYLHIPAEQVMTIGDQLNDIEMLQYAGYSVAMGNAQPMVKAAAKYVTGTNDQAGVSQAINKHILEK
ncbi:Cof-type HAD-IIB family hydrolase [Vaginisenegalia massiliensis]|uniref:Cof-type HAD-IIB family hydrolase n=1 Tax=Vaginisenegalia massiliensis TaxID=2058294 RepID=UPI000F54948B|nr:Cof-type HAD-IIB family hydrolase [Vaginisenegalia massiliensis]